MGTEDQEIESGVDFHFFKNKERVQKQKEQYKSNHYISDEEGFEEVKEYDKKQGLDKLEKIMDESGQINYEKLRQMEKKGITPLSIVEHS